jgi:hypothetical protein
MLASREGPGDLYRPEVLVLEPDDPIIRSSSWVLVVAAHGLIPYPDRVVK